MRQLQVRFHFIDAIGRNLRIFTKMQVIFCVMSKLCPILCGPISRLVRLPGNLFIGVFRVDFYAQGCGLWCEILHIQGLGHDRGWSNRLFGG